MTGVRRNEVLGDHCGQSQQSLLEFGLGLERSLPEGRTLWIVDGHRDGKRYVGRTDET